jgi:acylphosphatase
MQLFNFVQFEAAMIRKKHQPEHNSLVTERFRIMGNVGLPHFLPWIEGHARRLGLSMNASSQDGHRIDLVVSGPAELVDAMALGCSLGPIDVWVDAIEREQLQVTC